MGDMNNDDLKRNYEYYKSKCIRLQEEVFTLKRLISDMKLRSEAKLAPVPSKEDDFPSDVSTSKSEPQYDFSVRGKKRKQLPGYTCDQCERYYKAAGIDSKGVQQCTRHRGDKPPKTPPGWWDPGWTSPSKEATEKDAKKDACKKKLHTKF